MTSNRSGFRIEDIDSAFKVLEDEEFTPPPGELLRLTIVAEFVPCGKPKFHHGNGETCSRVKHILVPSDASGLERAAFIIETQTLLGSLARQCPACSMT